MDSRRFPDTLFAKSLVAATEDLKARIGLALVAMVVVLFALLPLSAAARTMGDGLRTEAEVDALVNSSLAAGDYVEGEAIVCWLDGDEGGLEAQADSLLANSEPLSQVSVRQYAEATGDPIPVAGLTTQSEDAPVRIALVHADGMGTEQLMRELLRDPRVLSAEPNYLMEIESEEATPLDEVTLPDEAMTPDEVTDPNEMVTPDEEPDPADVAMGPMEAAPDLTGHQWFSEGVRSTIQQHLDASNPGVGSPNWNQPGTTNAGGVVAIMDSGVDYTHPDLAGVMYHFSPELQAELGCGEFGYAPIRANKTDPMDGAGHGTHCAGIVAAEWNGFGVSGIASGTKIIAISVAKSLQDKQYSTDAVIKSYDFMIRAAKAGVDIRAVNRSLGISPICNANEVMMRAAGEAGIVTCEATGNNGQDLDGTVYEDTATSQPNPYIVRVNASNLQDGRVVFSNYGRYSSDLFAPGTAILSTMPSYDRRFCSYFPKADDNPVFLMTSFQDAAPDVSAPESNPINDITSGDIGVDGDGESLKVNVHARVGEGLGLFVDIPTGDLGKADIQDISIAVQSRDLSIRVLALYPLLDGGMAYEDEDGIFENDGCAGHDGWGLASLHILDPEAMDQDFAHVPDGQGNTCIRVAIRATLESDEYEDGTIVDTDLYLDQIAVGRPNNTGSVPYRYMSGTSMATPVASGCAAIVSSTIEDADPATRAAQTVRLLKGAVRQAEGYQGLCKQNGQIDLRLLGNEAELAPVIESAGVSGGTLVVSGAHFSSQGTLVVGGREVEVLSWADDTIEAVWPDGLASGFIPLAVRTEAGAESCRAFPLAAPADTPHNAPLYERDLTPVSVQPDRTNVTEIPHSLVATDDGTLFCAPHDGDGLIVTKIRHLMRSTDQGASWSGVELPQEFSEMRLVSGGDKMYMFGPTSPTNDNPTGSLCLYSYDPAADAFDLLATFEPFGSEVSKSGTLAYANGQLYYVDEYFDPDDWRAPSRLRIRPFAPDFGSLGEGLTLSHNYNRGSFYAGPMVATSGGSIYLCGISKRRSEDEHPSDWFFGLERVDVGDDGSLSCTELSSALAGLTDGAENKNVCMTASEEGIFLIGDGLDELLPSPSGHTDTFFLRNGESSFVPYARTLSYAPLQMPICAYADGWLYAYGLSRYEDMPVFGRATKVREDPEEPDGPEPQPTPVTPPQPSEPAKPAAAGGSGGGSSTRASVSRTKLPQTGDVPTGLTMIMLASFGSLAIVKGLHRRRHS